uniref:Tetratricopeptide TPR_2 repeat protein n=1 Tax=Solibacter usitatus (strain Ellin6076) TaxID=234267 RepID=Q029B0_SOLUE
MLTFTLWTGAQPAPSIAILYPLEGTLFPPEFPAPTFLFHDSSKAAAWNVEINFADGAAPIRVRASGEPAAVGTIDERCIGPTNRPPKAADARTWIPDAQTWSLIKHHSVGAPAKIAITGLSRAEVSIRTASDAVGAPIFYRDVPLMPSETEKGVIKPLAATMVPLIAWRLRDPAAGESRLLMTGIHSCANCHSFSADGKTMGMDVDGPANDKGLYAMAGVQPKMSIRKEDVIAWSDYRGKLGGKLRVGFMSQVSPEGRQVVTTINDPGQDQPEYQRRKNPLDLINNYFVANFKEYSFLQVFYPTRGILAWYDRAAGKLRPLPGADDPRYVHTNAVWSPDGKYLVFARAEARDAYTPGAQPAERANGANETPIQYDLYRIPFNGGAGGTAEPIDGASHNGMSNSFPKVSPDGRWIVWVQARNGQLMRPDSQLYIVPAAGGKARRMRANTPLMNSWHSFSPNSRWLVFSSKSRSPYTQMFLTHIDADGNDTPPVLIENATAANRAVNIPEFVNIAPGGLLELAAPAAQYYAVIDSAVDLVKSGRRQDAIGEWRKALALAPAETTVHFNLANALFETGKTEEAIAEYGKTLELSPEHVEAHNNLGNALVREGRSEEAMAQFEATLQLDPAHANAHANLGAAMAQRGRIAEGIAHLEKAIELDPGHAQAHSNLGIALAMSGRLEDAIRQVEESSRLSAGQDAMTLDLLAALYAEAGRFGDAASAVSKAIARAQALNQPRAVEAMKAKLANYQERARHGRE